MSGLLCGPRYLKKIGRIGIVPLYLETWQSYSGRGPVNPQPPYTAREFNLTIFTKLEIAQLKSTSKVSSWAVRSIEWTP